MGSRNPLLLFIGPSWGKKTEKPKERGTKDMAPKKKKVVRPASDT